MKKYYFPFLLVATLGVWNSGQAHTCPSNCVTVGTKPQTELTRHIATDFELYRDYHKALNVQAHYQIALDAQAKACHSNKHPSCKSTAENQRELQHYMGIYVVERNKARANLQADLTLVPYAFDHGADKNIQQFLAWNSAHLNDTINTPNRATDKQYAKWENAILRNLVNSSDETERSAS